MRSRLHLLTAVLAFSLLAAASPTAAVEVVLTVAERANAPRNPGVVSSGVPFARGAVTDLTRLSVSADGKPLPAQFLPLARWDDGSIRWALLDAQIDIAAGGKVALIVRDDGKNVAPPAAIRTSLTADGATISTGPLEAAIDRRAFNLFKFLKIDGKERISGGRGLVLVTADGKQLAAGPPDHVSLEQVGPVRTTLLLRGKFPGVHEGLLGYTVRITAYAGSRALKLRVWLENHGQHGYVLPGHDMASKQEWFWFDGLAVELGLEGGPVSASSEGVQAAGKFKVLQTCRATGKGGEFEQMHFTVAGADGELKTGQRTDGVVTFSGLGGALTCGVRHFWQNYDKAIELDGSTVRLWLWPTEGQWPRAGAVTSHTPADLRPLARPNLYALPGAVHKGHEMILDFSGRDARQSSAELSEPLFAIAAPEYYASTEAAGVAIAPADARTGHRDCDGSLAAWVRMARTVSDRDNESSVWRARQSGEGGRGFSFGWMDFGDIPVLGGGTANLHHDWPWIALANLLRTGDVNSLRLAEEMVAHRVDIDQDWSDRTIIQYRGLQRASSTAHFHTSGFTSNLPNVGTTWLAGVVLYHMLTGDIKALEAANRTAEHLASGWDWASRPREHKDYTMRSMVGDMRAVSESMLSYCAMFDITGERRWLDAAIGLFDRYVVPKWEAHGPHLHQLTQIQSQEYLREDVRYCYSIAALCELHRRTGHEKLFELLKAGCDKEFPDNYFLAPLYLANLHAYVGSVTGQQKYFENATEMWASAFPLSKNPPVYMSGSSIWTREAAAMLRTGHLLQYCFWKKARQK